jgi:hypothetical protein
LTLIITGLVILIVIIFLLALPLEIEVLALVHGHADLRVRLKLIYGLISWKLNKARGPDSEPVIQPEGKDDLAVFSNIYEAVQTRGIWEQIQLLLKRLSGHVKIRHIESDFKISLGDDHYTGMLAGLTIPLALILNQRFGADIRMVPAFEEDLVMEGYLKSSIGVRPVEVIIPCLAFLCSPSVRQVRKILF